MQMEVALAKYTHLKYFTQCYTTYNISRDFEAELLWLKDAIIYSNDFVVDNAVRTRYNDILITLKHLRNMYINLVKQRYLMDSSTDDILTKFIDISFLPFIKNPEFDFDKYIYHRHTNKICISDMAFSLELYDQHEFIYYYVLNQIEELEFELFTKQ